MTEREKIARIIAEHLCPQGKSHKTLYGAGRMCYSRQNFVECDKVCDCVDALIEAGIRDTKERRWIFMNGEAIVPSPDIYNKVAKLLDCPLMLDVPDERHVLSDGTTENDDKRRAEVAEKALRNLAQFCAKSARFYLQSNKAVKEREQELYDEWIAQAEKDLAEEKKQ